MFSRGHGTAKVTAMGGMGDEGLSVRLASNLFRVSGVNLKFTKQ